MPYLNQDDACFLGNRPITKCPHFRGSPKNVDTLIEEGDHFAVGWYGSAFGMRDLDFVSARAQQNIVGIIGPQNSGKTSFLTALYLMLNHGEQITIGNFAGSYTFNGWEKIARNLRFNPGQLQPHFPPHTPRSTDDNSRVPGLLHLALRKEDGHLRDYIFTDPPGEWFNLWAINKNDPAAEGARWIAKNATSIAFFVDCERLSGNERGVESGRIERLTQRLSSEIGERPVAIVWAKSDIEVKEEMRTRLRKVFQDAFPKSAEFEVAAIPPEQKTKNKTKVRFQKGYGVLETVNWLCRERFETMPIHLPEPQTTDPFLGFRGAR